ncbi:MAG: tandem-95 repeat protein [Candidatus Marinimicrobia bacterium]|nr:tandem-95 repeat protein [Candidatus Neomarinimicrobiota bacterium]MBL7023019.1 tandem-95 repeat protein [Candidatus Neomarinimicrobiota bacterium]MBL7109659.1 tandem-95 repeat protein [Candidatus Neomarinimicrobiota bacterium]
MRLIPKYIILILVINFTGWLLAQETPVANDDFYSVLEDEILQVETPGVLENDSGDNPLIALLVQSATLGTLNLEENGAFTYIPYENINGIDTFTYRTFDSTESDTATVTITINPVNDAPQVIDDIYSVDEDSFVEITLTGSDFENDPLTFEITSSPQYGTFQDGIYTPNNNYYGEDSFDYRAWDGVEYSNIGTINISVVSINDIPIAVGEDYIINEDEELQVDTPGLLENDYDIENDVLSIQLEISTNYGTLNVNENGSFTYNPNSNYFGNDHFSYYVSDGQDQSNIVEVNITISSVDDPPMAITDSYFVMEDEAISEGSPGVLINDYDGDGDNLSAELVESTLNGQLELFSDGSFSYAPNQNYNGEDSFTYLAFDGGLYSEATGVIITINSVNDAPVVTDLLIETNEDISIEIPFLGSDIENDELEYYIVDYAQNGQIIENSYLPNENFNGMDSFTYRAFDGSDYSNIAQCVITVFSVNDPPESVSDFYETDEDVELIVNLVEIGVLNNDSDPDMQYLSAVIVSETQNGNIEFQADGTFSYTSNENYNGEDYFTYQAFDGNMYSEITEVLITIVAINDAPVVTDLLIETNEDISIEIHYSGNDVENDNLEYYVVDHPQNGQIIGNSYIPNNNYFGSDSFTYRAFDGNENSNIAQGEIMVYSVNDSPIAISAEFETEEDVILSILLTGEDPVELDYLTYFIQDSTVNGYLSGTTPEIIFNPNPNFFGDDSLTFYVVDDGNSNGEYDPQPSELATIYFSVISVNDPPTFSLSGDITVNEDFEDFRKVEVESIDIPQNEIDEIIIFAIEPLSVQFAEITFDSTSGEVEIHPIENGNGIQEFTITANDGIDSTTDVFTLIVNQINDAPFINSITFDDNGDNILEDTTSANVFIDYYDIDADTILNSNPFSLDSLVWDFHYTTNPMHLWFTPENDSFVIDSLLADWNGIDSITVNCTDDSNAVYTQTFFIEVQQVNDIPIEFQLLSNLQEYPLDSTVFFYDSLQANFVYRLPVKDEPQTEQEPEKFLFIWERSYDIDTDAGLNNDKQFNLNYRLELVNNTSDFTIVLKDTIPDELFDSSEFCNNHLNANEVCNTEILSDSTYAFWSVDLSDSLIAYLGSDFNPNDTTIVLDLSGNTQYYWRVLCQNFENDVFGNDPIKFSNTTNEILLDLVLPKGEFYIHQNELISEYFDLYVESSEEMVIHDNLDEKIEIWVNTANYPQYYALEGTAENIYHIASSFIDTGLTTLIFQGRDRVQNYGRTQDSVYYKLVLPRYFEKVISPSGTAKIAIPAGSLDSETGILVVEKEIQNSLDKSENYQIIPTVTISPVKTEFNNSVSLTFEIPEDYLSTDIQTWKFQIMEFINNKWERVNSRYESGTITAQICKLGSFAVFLDESITEPIPDEYSLISVYPNPANGSTVIRYSLPEKSNITIQVFDILGREVVTLFDNIQSQGYHEVNWNFYQNENIPISSGLYFVKLNTADFTQTEKIMVLK